jgi:hypothetical protein
MSAFTNALFQIKDKMKMALVLLIIIAVILLCNISLRHSFKTLDAQMHTIYKDRLIPSNYLFSMAEILFQKRLHLDEGIMTPAATSGGMANDSLSQLIKSYEITYLTRNEEQVFNNFKNAWKEYQQNEESFKTGVIPMGNRQEMYRQLREMQLQLQQLGNIQVEEGTKLHLDARKVVKGTQVELQLEISLLIILGVIALVLLSIREKLISKKRENEWLN